MRVTNSMPLGCLLPLTVHTFYDVTKARTQAHPSEFPASLAPLWLQACSPAHSSFDWTEESLAALLLLTPCTVPFPLYQPTPLSNQPVLRALLTPCTVLVFEQRIALEDAIYWGSRCCVTSSVRWQSSWLGCCTRGCYILGFTMLLGVTPGHACDVISVVV
jgi:hypothetical protein